LASRASKGCRTIPSPPWPGKTRDQVIAGYYSLVRTAAQAEAWLAAGGWAHSNIRSYQGALALFLEYVCDPRYGWVSECEQRAGAVPVQVFHERNSAAHVSEHEGRAEQRPLAGGLLAIVVFVTGVWLSVLDAEGVGDALALASSGLSAASHAATAVLRARAQTEGPQRPAGRVLPLLLCRAWQPR
jgi:hypothetical protein